MKHHFVPRFYLKSFCERRTPPGQEPWLWVADLEERSVERRAPKNVAAQTDYYLSREIEQALAQLESETRPVIAKLLAGESNLIHEDRGRLAFFMAYFIVRVPFFRNMIEEKAGEVGRMRLMISAQHPDHFARTLREAHKGMKEFTHEEVENLRQWALNGEYSVRGTAALSLSLGMTEIPKELAAIVHDMKWAYLEPGSDEEFITCDNPVSWFDATPRAAVYGGHGLLMKNVELTFPLSPQLCLLGSWVGKTGPIQVPRLVIEELNQRRIRFASRFVYAAREKDALRALESAKPADSSGRGTGSQGAGSTGS